MTREDPPVSSTEFELEKAWWEKNRKNLDHLVRGKDPMPDEGDIRIMLQASKLQRAGKIHVFSRDAHFLGYAAEIEARYHLLVRHGGELPSLLNDWGA